jgi:hypothetical protein
VNAKDALRVIESALKNDETSMLRSAQQAAADALREKVEREEAERPKPTLKEQEAQNDSSPCSGCGSGGGSFCCDHARRCADAAADTLRRLREVGQRAVNAMQPNVRDGRVTSYTGDITATIRLLQLLVDVGLRETP